MIRLQQLGSVTTLNPLMRHLNMFVNVERDAKPEKKKLHNSSPNIMK